MDDTSGVRFIHCRGQAFKNPGCFLDRDRALVHPVGERAAGHVAHDKIRLPVFFPEVIDWHNGWVFQHGDGLGFALEANAELRVVQHFARQDFDRHLTLEARVIGLVNGGHAAAAKLGFDLVTSDLLWIHTISNFKTHNHAWPQLDMHPRADFVWKVRLDDFSVDSNAVGAVQISDVEFLCARVEGKLSMSA